VDLGIVAARRGDLDGAVTYGESAFEFECMSVTDLLVRPSELDRTIQPRYRGERLAREFHERHLNAARLKRGATEVLATEPSLRADRLD